METIVEIHNWLKYREYMIVGCPAPSDTLQYSPYT